MDNTPSSPFLLELKTVQATTFKQVIDALKEILMDVNLEFDETGLKIVAMDTTHVVMVHLKLMQIALKIIIVKRNYMSALIFLNYIC